MCTVAKLARAGEPQEITVHGKGSTVLISRAEYDRLSGRKRKTVSDLFRSNPAKGLNFTVARHKEKLRNIDL